MTFPTAFAPVQFTLADFLPDDSVTVSVSELRGYIVGSYRKFYDGTAVVVHDGSTGPAGPHLIELSTNPVAAVAGVVTLTTSSLPPNTSTTAANAVGGRYVYTATIDVGSVVAAVQVEFNFVIDEQGGYTLVDGAIAYTDVSTDSEGVQLPAPAASYSINDLTDVDTVTAAPNSSEVLTWNGSAWAPSVAAVGDMTAATYDPHGVAGDSFARASHTGTQTAATISDFDTEVSNNSSVTANTAKTGITAGQASEITANTSKVSYTDAALVATHTTDIATNASGVSTNATTVFNLGTDVAGHHSRLATIDSGQVTQDSAIAANTAKVSYTDAAIVATAIQPADTVADLAPIPATTQSGTTYTLELSDVFSMVLLSNAALVTVTVPTNASVAFPVGTQIALQSTGAGGVTLTTTSLTLNGSTPNTTIAQNEVMVLEKTGTDTWSVLGGTAA